MAPGTRFLLAGLAVAFAEVILALILLPASIAAYLFACAATSALFAVAARRLFEPPGNDDDGGGGGGGGGPEDPSPPWWPQFEAEYRRYARERTRTPVG